MRIRSALIAAAAVLTLAANPSIAQGDDPERIMLETSDALARSDGFTARVTLKGDGSKLITSTMPTLTGRFTLGKHPEHGPTVHAVGEIIERQGAEPESFEFMRSGERLAWTDHARSRVTICDPENRPNGTPSPVGYLLSGRFVGDKPLDTLLGMATGYTLEDPEVIDGVECLVVAVALPDPERGESRSHGVERWAVGADDRLPRRIEQFTDAGIIKATLIVGLSSLTESAVEPDQLEILKPENYTLRDMLTRAEPEPEPTTQPEPAPEREVQAQPEPEPPSAPMAPAFALRTASGADITNATQRGRVTLIAFGGSWCIPCRDLVPALSDIARAHAERDVDVVYAAVRERDPDAALETHESRGYAHLYAPQTPGAVTNAFKVRIYPTVVVIDAQGRIALEAHLDAEHDADALAGMARDAVGAALNDAP